MIGRRAMIMGLIGSPVAGKAALAKAASIAAKGAVAVGPGESVEVDTVRLESGPSPVLRAANRHIEKVRNAEERKRYAGEQAARGHLPPHISSKNSWSAVYKAHVAAREAEIRNMDHYNLDDATLIGVAKALGFEP